MNRIIRKNFNEQNSWCHKIADPAGVAATMASKNPFDGFFYSYNFNGCYEAKLIKNNYKAWNFNTIKDHQLINLKNIKNICNNQKTKTLTIFILGIFIPHKEFSLYIFDIDFILFLKNKNKKSITKKELLQLKKDNKYISIKNNIFDINLIFDKLIL